MVSIKTALFGIRYSDWHQVYLEEIQRGRPLRVMMNYPFRTGASKEELLKIREKTNG